MVEAGDDGSLSSEPGEVEAVACPTEAGALEAGSDGPGALLAPLEPSSPQSHQPGDPPVLPYMSSRASGLEGSRPDVAPLCIAPMMEWTDRHYRYMMRLLTRHTTLYTEMIVDETLLYQRDRQSVFLGHGEEERPLVVQLGGGDPHSVAEAAAMCEAYGGFTEINLNVGCPSPKVSKRCFGARLMLDPERVRRIVYEMGRQVTCTPITVKCRIGADHKDSYEDLCGFTSAVRSAGVRHLIVHARKCLLKGLSPAANRNIPPLRYQVVHDLCRDFSDMAITINGGVNTFTQALGHLGRPLEAFSHVCCPCNPPPWNEANSPVVQWGGYAPPVQGVMVGRTAYNSPWTFRHADSTFYNATDPGLSRREVVERYLDYANSLLERYGHLSTKEIEVEGANSPGTLVKPLHNLFSGERGGRLFRRRLSELWKDSERHIEFTELVTTALEEAIDKDILDAPATCTRLR